MVHGLSLHIGLNSVNPDRYAGWDGKLVACENDAQDMQQRIAKPLGYAAQVLLTKTATSEAVMAAISDAARQLDRGDILFLSYSGHGGQVDDLNGDEPDRKDETWVLYDRELIDDELHELYTTFKPGVRIVVLSDSCHSGTVTRALYEQTAPLEADAGLRSHRVFRSKRIPRDIEAAVYRENQSQFEALQARTRDAVKKAPEATVILISGCQDRQLSSDGDVNGLFTENLLSVWDDGRFKQGYRQFQKAIKHRMPPSQQPNYFVVGAPNKAFEQQQPFSIAAPPAS